jgi:hypothetical protein
MVISTAIKIPILGADAVQMAEGNTFGRVIASARTTRRGQRPWHVQTLLAREPGDLAIDRSATAVGPHRVRTRAVVQSAIAKQTAAGSADDPDCRMLLQTLAHHLR